MDALQFKISEWNLHSCHGDVSLHMSYFTHVLETQPSLREPTTNWTNWTFVCFFPMCLCQIKLFMSVLNPFEYWPLQKKKKNKYINIFRMICLNLIDTFGTGCFITLWIIYLLQNESQKTEILVSFCLCVQPNNSVNINYRLKMTDTST